MIDENEIDRGYEDEFKDLTKDETPVKAAEEPMAEPAKAVPQARIDFNKMRDDDAKAFSDVFYAPDEKPKAAMPESAKLGAPIGKAAEPAAPTSFKQAFAQARKDGLKVFEFNGKKYTTALKSEMKAKPAAPSPESQTPAPMSDKAKPVATKSASVSTRSQMPEPRGDKAEPQERPSVYGDNFIKDAVNSIKSKLDDKSQVGKAKVLPNGRPNLTAM